MAKPNHLVILGSTMTALALLRAARTFGMDVSVVDTTRGIAFSSRLAALHCVPPGTADILARLLSIAGQHRCLLIADSDHWLRFVASHRAVIADAFCDILHPSNACFELCLNKTAFLNWCATQSLSAPRVYTVDGTTLRPEPCYPLLIRPRETRHNMDDGIPKAVTVKSASELKARLEQYARAKVDADVCESLLSPTVMAFSVGAARDREGHLLSFVAQKVRTPPAYCSGGTFVAIHPQRTVEELAREALTRLEYYGIAEVEVLFEPATGSAHLIEINARPWVQYSLAERTGHHFLRFLCDGTRPPAPRPQAGAGAWMNLSDDLLVCFSNESGLVRTGQLSVSDYLSSLWQSNAYALWNRRDPRPFLHSTRRFFLRSLRLGRAAKSG